MELIKLTVYIMLALTPALIIYSLHITKKDNKKRMKIGVILLYSFLASSITFPLLFMVTLEFEVVVTLALFHLILMLCGIIITIAGLSTKTESIEK